MSDGGLSPDRVIEERHCSLAGDGFEGGRGRELRCAGSAIDGVRRSFRLLLNNQIW
jgi:hypothetical protein